MAKEPPRRKLRGFFVHNSWASQQEYRRFSGYRLTVRLSDFQTLMADEFGAAYAAVLLRDLALIELGDMTGQKALEAGIDPKEIWQAICKAQNVPNDRWHGLNKKPKDRHAD